MPLKTRKTTLDLLVLHSFIALLCSLASASARAAEEPPADDPGNLIDMSLVELMQLPVDRVYGASKYEQKVTRAPASVTIVTAEDIRRFGHRTLADVLRSTAGLYVGNDRYYSRVGFRGFSRPGDLNTGILMLVDGHRVNDVLLNLMFVAHEEMIDVDMIDRVEIIRGPSSSIYGNSAFFGVINIISKGAGQLSGTQVSAEAGSFDTYKLSLAHGRKVTDDLEWTASGSYYGSGGQERLYYPEYADPQTNNGFAVNSDDEHAAHFHGTLALHDFTLSAAYFDRRRSVPTAPFGTAFNSGKYDLTDQHGYVDLKYEHALRDDLALMGRVSYDWYPYAATLPYDNPGFSPDPIINRDVSVGRWARSELQLTRRWRDRHTLIVGAEYQNNLRQYQANYDEEPYTNYLDIDHGSTTYAVYTQGEFALGKQLLLNAGVRYDHFYSFGSTVNPRLGLIYNPYERTTFKLLYGEAFRAPNEYELNYESSTYERNPDLQPETIRTYELVYEQYLPGNLRFSAAGYHYEIQGLISQTINPANGLIVFRNLGEVHADGVELQLQAHIARGVLANGSYALQRAEDVATGLALSNSPRHLAKLNLSVPLSSDELSGSLELQYQSRVITAGRLTESGFLLVNASLFRQQLATDLDLSATIYNLFDQRYSTPSSDNLLQAAIEQNGRSFRLKLTKTFK
jgi:iron complex outermembrane receptor protein